MSKAEGWGTSELYSGPEVHERDASQAAEWSGKRETPILSSGKAGMNIRMNEWRKTEDPSASTAAH